MNYEHAVQLLHSGGGGKPRRGLGLLIVQIEKLVSGGAGLARLQDGEAILLAGALPGETVAIEAGPKVKGARRGRVIEVLEPSSLRAGADCPLAGRCGGCDFLHVQAGAALGLKSQAALGELAARFSLTAELVESPLREHYRSRATLHLGLKTDGRIGAGFYDAQRQLIEFDHCRLIAPALNDLAHIVRLWATGLSPDWAGMEVNLMAGCDDSGQAVVISPCAPLLKPGRFKASAPKLPGDFQVHLKDLAAECSAAGSGLISVFSGAGLNKPPVKITLGGPDRLAAAVWPEWNLVLRVTPGGFTQVNPPVNKLMVEKILELAESARRPGATALDLYAGVGNISLPLAKSGFAVTAVESAPGGVQAAKENGRNVPGFTVIGETTAKAVASLSRQGRRYDLIVLDPPRAGARDLAPALAALSPATIIYIACHPSVLARDLPAFVSLGYSPQKLVALDMFPRTSHLEALVMLQRL